MCLRSQAGYSRRSCLSFKPPIQPWAWGGYGVLDQVWLLNPQACRSQLGWNSYIGDNGDQSWRTVWTKVRFLRTRLWCRRFGWAPRLKAAILPLDQDLSWSRIESNLRCLWPWVRAPHQRAIILSALHAHEHPLYVLVPRFWEWVRERCRVYIQRR